MSAAASIVPWAHPHDSAPLRDALHHASAAVEQGCFAVGSEWLRYAAELCAPDDARRAWQLEEASKEVLAHGRRESRVVPAMGAPPPLPQPAPLPESSIEEEPLPLLTPIGDDEDDEPTAVRQIWMPAIEEPDSEIGMTGLRVSVVASADGRLVCRPLLPDESSGGGVAAMLVAPTSHDAARLAELLDRTR